MRARIDACSLVRIGSSFCSSRDLASSTDKLSTGGRFGGEAEDTCPPPAPPATTRPEEVGGTALLFANPTVPADIKAKFAYRPSSPTTALRFTPSGTSTGTSIRRGWRSEERRVGK